MSITDFVISTNFSLLNDLSNYPTFNDLQTRPKGMYQWEDHLKQYLNRFLSRRNQAFFSIYQSEKVGIFTSCEV
jgi:hypothetical protein